MTDDYLMARAAAEAALLQPADSMVPCDHCGGSGQFRDEYRGAPDCFAPCPYCWDRRAHEASLATIAPAFAGVL